MSISPEQEALNTQVDSVLAKLTDPDMVGTTSYRAVREAIEDALNSLQAEDEQDPLGLAVAQVEGVIEEAQGVLATLRGWSYEEEPDETCLMTDDPLTEEQHYALNEALRPADSTLPTGYWFLGRYKGGTPPYVLGDGDRVDLEKAAAYLREQGIGHRFEHITRWTPTPTTTEA